MNKILLNINNGYSPSTMKLQVCSTVFFLLWFSLVRGQIAVSGTVTDAEGRPIQQAEVYLKELQRLQTTSVNGSFEFSDVSIGKYTMVVFALEYEVFEKEFTLDRPFSLNIQLEPLRAEELSEVVLTQRR